MYKPPTRANLQEYGKAWVDHLFEDMNNPEFMGENFTWEGFPDMVVRLACASLPMSYDSNKKHEIQLEGIVRVLANEKIKTVLME